MAHRCPTHGCFLMLAWRHGEYERWECSRCNYSETVPVKPKEPSDE